MIFYDMNNLRRSKVTIMYVVREEAKLYILLKNGFKIIFFGLKILDCL